MRRTAGPRALPWQRRFASTDRPTAQRSGQTHRNPLSARNPAARNVPLPAAAHQQRDVRTAEQQAAALRTHARRRSDADVLWTGSVIRDRDHSVPQHFATLGKSPRYRESRGLGVVSGLQLMRELHEQGHHPKTLVVSAEKGIPDWADGSRTQIVRADPRVVSEIDPGTDGYLGDFELPRAAMKEELMANVEQMRNVLVLDNVDDPGQLGTLLRTAAAFAYDAVFLTSHCADLYDNRTIRAGRGVHFQSSTPFYVLRSEDGDDVYGMLNHVAARNNLQPSVYSPKLMLAPPSEDTRGPAALSCGGAAVAAPPAGIRRAVKSLHRFCMDEYHDNNTGPSAPVPTGRMMVMGPDHHGTLLPRMEQRMARPLTTILLEDDPLLAATPSDLSVTAPVLLHQFRYTAEWDYLPLSKRHDRSTSALQSSQRVRLAPNQLLPPTAPNESEEEYARSIHDKRAAVKARRLANRALSDEDVWRKYENERLVDMAQANRAKMATPWNTRKPRNAPAPPDVPNPIDEAPELGLDRDSLRDEAEWAATYEAPPNYEYRGEAVSEEKPRRRRAH